MSIRAVSQEEEDSCSSNTSSDENSTSDSDEMREVDEDGASRFRRVRLPIFNIRCGSLSNTSLCLCPHAFCVMQKDQLEQSGHGSRV